MNGKRATPVRVLIVDDSAVVRSLLTKLLGVDPRIEVVGTAADPFIARDKLLALSPDVMTLDLEMPRMDGLTFLAKVMEFHPTRTVVISAFTAERCALSLQALALGAIDVIDKPRIDIALSLAEMGADLVERVISAAGARLRGVPAKTEARPKPALTGGGRHGQQILAIASSTGGTEALKVLLGGLPADAPGTVIVQHMPPFFTKVYADTLNRMLPLEVKEAADGDRVQPGRVLLAPGNFHMELVRTGASFFVRLNQAPPIHGVRPAADVLLHSVARAVGRHAIGVVLTGMGKDGAAGLMAMKAAGSHNIAQDEATSVIFGMPKAAIERGAIHQVSPLEAIAGLVLKQLNALTLARDVS